MEETLWFTVAKQDEEKFFKYGKAAGMFDEDEILQDLIFDGEIEWARGAHEKDLLEVITGLEGCPPFKYIDSGENTGAGAFINGKLVSVVTMDHQLVAAVDPDGEVNAMDLELIRGYLKVVEEVELYFAMREGATS